MPWLSHFPAHHPKSTEKTILLWSPSHSNDQFKTFLKSPSALQAQVFETLEGNEVKDLDSPGRQIPSAKAAVSGAGMASAGQGWQPCPSQLRESREQYNPESSTILGAERPPDCLASPVQGVLSLLPLPAPCSSQDKAWTHLTTQAIIIPFFYTYLRRLECPIISESAV